ncbi:MAG: hypothetical protein JSV30_02670 [Candidatus Omnitrophota bacterium]|nr:MAG: hypothetical protein JSV30_02670 [Candidatus Omnitrophota bacterium]
MKKTLVKKIMFCLGLLAVLSLIAGYPLVRAQRTLKRQTGTVEYTGRGLRDPFESPFELFVPLEEVPKEKKRAPIAGGLAHLVVQGMIWDSKIPQAIINNTVVRPGEVIEGAEILDIRKEGVYVLYEGNQYILRPTILREDERLRRR